MRTCSNHVQRQAAEGLSRLVPINAANSKNDLPSQQTSISSLSPLSPLSSIIQNPWHRQAVVGVVVRTVCTT